MAKCKLDKPPYFCKPVYLSWLDEVRTVRYERRVRYLATVQFSAVILRIREENLWDYNGLDGSLDGRMERYSYVRTLSYQSNVQVELSEI